MKQHITIGALRGTIHVPKCTHSLFSESKYRIFADKRLAQVSFVTVSDKEVTGAPLCVCVSKQGKTMRFNRSAVLKHLDAGTYEYSRTAYTMTGEIEIIFKALKD